MERLRDFSETNREGSSLLGLSNAAEQIGFKTLAVKIDFNTLYEDVPMPCIVFWQNKHFVVVYKIEKKRNNYIIYVSDPAFGLIQYNLEEFLAKWIGKEAEKTTEEGVVLVLEKTAAFEDADDDGGGKKKMNAVNFFAHYFAKYRKLILQLMLGLIGGSILSLAFPFLTQAVVDIGIQNQDLKFIYLIFLAQLMLFLGQTAIAIIRGWILLHLSARINISIVSDFFIKLMRLPISFFDTRITADIMQRIADQARIEQLLTNNSLQTLFSLINFIVFGFVLALYNYVLFLLFLVGSAIYVIWISVFLKKRRLLDYRQFSEISEEQGRVMELINGMQEIKLNNAEKRKRWQWEGVQIKL